MLNTDKKNFIEESTEFFLKNTLIFFKPFLNGENEFQFSEIEKWWKEHLNSAFNTSMSSDNLNFEKMTLLRGTQAGNLYKWFMNELLQGIKDNSMDFTKENISEIYYRLYGKGFGLFKDHVIDSISAPPLWLEHENMKKITKAFEAYSDLMNSVAQFSDKFSIPFQRSLLNFIQKIGELENLDPVQDPKKLYKELVRTLDKEYDDFLKTEQGVDIVMDVVDKLLVCQHEINNVKEIWLKFFSIPTKGEMEIVYKNIYELKKQNRGLEKTIKYQTATIDQLIKRVEYLEKEK